MGRVLSSGTISITLTASYLLLSLGMNFNDMEFEQCRMFFPVNPSPTKTWPRWAPHAPHWISVLSPSASGTLLTAPSISSSKLGQPHLASNLSSERYRGASHLLQT